MLTDTILKGIAHDTSIHNKRKPWTLPYWLLRPEFYPTWLLYAPATIYTLIRGFSKGNPLFFTAANPGIDTGGLIGDNKLIISDLIPDLYKPTGLLISPDDTMNTIASALVDIGLHFPLIAKPLIGRRGTHVAKIDDMEALMSYKTTMDQLAFMVESYINWPVEAGVMYWRNRATQTSGISSLTLKKMLAVTGDGAQTVGELILASPRKSMHYDRLQRTSPELMAKIPADGENVTVEPIGNHCRGTVFIDARHLIDASMVAAFDAIMEAIPGVDFCRLDIKCQSIESLCQGHSLYILEINGVGAEPGHIYSPNYPLWRIWKDTIASWRLRADIGDANIKAGAKSANLRDLIQAWKAEKKYGI